MSILDAYDESTQQVAKVMDAAPLPEPVPEPKHSAWTVVPRALAGAALEVAGNLVDVGSMIGQVAEGETRDYGDFEPLNTRPEASRPHYEMAREMRPDPLTAGLAENVIFGVGKGLSKAAFAVTAGGVLPGAAAFGLSEGMTTSEDLAEQGVDAATRQKVGTVTGVVSGASVLLPVAGTSLLKTAGLVAAGGPAAYIAQETIIKDILEEADYQKIADQHDPLDPVGLAVSTLLPAAFGAMAMRGAFKGKATQEQVDAAMVHNTTLKADQFEAETPQAVAAMKQAEESVKDIRATYEHTGDIGKAVTERLMDLGVPAQEAADKGLLWDTFFKSMESTTGKEAGQLFGKYFDRVFNAGEDLPDDAVMHGDVLAQGVKLGYPEDYGFVPDQPAPDEVTNSANIAALRRTAAGLERPEDGVTLHVTDDGRAIATGPKGTRVPETFVRFAQENGLKFMAQRQLGSVRPIITHGNIGDHYGSAMPVDYRAAGALYFNEMGKAFVDRTGRALFQSQFDLKAQTPEELAARAKDEELAQKGDLAAQKRQADRATADALRNEFKLTGSDRPADVAAAHGQQALFQMADRAHAKAIETPEFKRWFGDSKVVDAEGKPLVVYHGTRGDFDTFENKGGTVSSIFGSEKVDRQGFFFSDDPKIASEFAEQGEKPTGGNVMPVHLSVRNPLDLRGGFVPDAILSRFEDMGINSRWLSRFDWSNFDDEAGKEFVAAAKKLGYDGVFFREDNPNGGESFPVYVAFHPEQIKSAIGNRGTFDPNDPNILKQSAGDGARGFLEFGQNGKMGIGLLASADKSTFLHESGHFFLEVMNDLSNEANAPPELRADMQAIHEWMGVSREQWASMSLEQKRPYHEQWARGFEQYLMEGKAPTSRLKEAFARFRDWLIEIYKSATALNVTLSDDVRKVMDNMLTVKESEPRQSPTGDGVPPPRASIGEDSAGNSDLDKALTSGEPLLDKIRPLDDPDLVATLQDMAANETGWAERGGYMMRENGEEGKVTGRTQWIPKAEWWPDRPAAGIAKRRLNADQVAEAVRKHIAGEPLKPLELQTVEYMSKIANDRLNSVEMIGEQEFGNTMQDWVAESVEPTTEKVFDSQAVARALDLNPEATMQAMERYDIHDDDAIIMAEIRSIIDEAGQQSLETAQGRAEDTGKEADPIQSEAERIVAEDPERRIPIGTGPDGEAVTLTAREYLDQARAQADQARQDVNLIKAAAECLLGQI